MPIKFKSKPMGRPPIYKEGQTWKSEDESHTIVKIEDGRFWFTNDLVDGELMGEGTDRKMFSKWVNYNFAVLSQD